MAPKTEARAPKPSDEGGAITQVGRALAALTEQAAKDRVLRWALSAHGSPGISALAQASVNRGSQRGSAAGAGAAAPSQDLGELLEQAKPQTQDDRVLVISHWLQETQSPDGFVAQTVNNQLKDIGHTEAHITDKFNQLIHRSPALIRQVSKSGKAKQARKKYKVTDAGTRRVLKMIAGEADADQE